MASDGEISCANDPNFAVIFSFLKVFGKLHGINVPTLAKLQEFIENTQEVLDPLKELHLRLLRRALKSVQSNRWERGLIKFCHQQGHHQEAWEIERFSYKKASTQVKLKVLKVLLEFQFTCHPKFKSTVNAISCKDLRLDPIGRDKNGCVYWLQVDDHANLCLYKEDQDEETWQLVARNREELVKVIAQLKSGEEVCPLVASNSNEDSSSTEIPSQLEPAKSEPEDDNEEEFLSPESESEHEGDDPKEKNVAECEKTTTEEAEKDNKEQCTDEKVPDESDTHTKTLTEANKITVESNEVPLEANDAIAESNDIPSETNDTLTKLNVTASTSNDITTETNEIITETNEAITESIDTITEKNETIIEPIVSPTETATEKPVRPNIEELTEKNESESEEVSEAIEEPVMVVTGEGNGADCESSYFFGEEIIEDVMFFYGEGCGYENETGNPEAIQQANNAEDNSDEENGNEDCLNGEHPHELSNSSSISKLSKSVKLNNSVPSVTKRSLKKQSNDTTEVLKTDSKKHCVRDLDNCDVSKPAENDLKRESSVNDNNASDSDNSQKNNVKKSRTKVKKKRVVSRKIKLNKEKEVINSVTEPDNGHDSKSSIIEKRKSSVSSVDHEETDQTENEKEKSPDKELKVEDPLPPKKLRLDTPESDNDVSHSKEATSDSIENNDSKAKDNLGEENNPVSQRKKIKANKGKFKRKKILKNKIDNSVDKDVNDSNKKECKSLKRSLLDASMSDKNKSESQTESEDDEPVTSGKRQKIKPKKIITSSRKKVEAKLLEKHSSESEEETLYSIAGKKSPKKVLKKKPKGKEKSDKKDKSKGKLESDDSDQPVRQSRRIAQMKIKEEADRRHLEEVALRELKMIHKKKGKDDEDEDEEEEEEWVHSGSSSGGTGVGAGAVAGAGAGSSGRTRRWRGSVSTGPEPDSDSEPLFDVHEPQEEPDLVFDKSDHEFSPESDLESGEPVEPMKRARTLQQGKDDGFCKRCGSGEQPEWILLCDKCDVGYHASCLKPMLFLVPEGDWFCPPCNHDMLIASLESELVKYDELVVTVEAERERRKLEEPLVPTSEALQLEHKEVKKEKSVIASGSSWSSSSSSSEEEAAVYRLRARRQLPVSYRSQEYDRLISSAIKEEYVEPTTSAGNQGRGKDISTIIEAAEEEKMKAEREAVQQGKPVDMKKLKKKRRRKPRKLNSLDVPSEDDDETDEDFKDTGMVSSSEEISTSNERDSSRDSCSSDSLPIRRLSRPDNRDRPNMAESSPEVKKKKGVFEDSSSESAGAKEWSDKAKTKQKSKHHHKSHRAHKSHKSHRSKGHKSRDHSVSGRPRVTYGGLSDDDDHDRDHDHYCEPKPRTRQKKINYTEMPNTESEDEIHKSSGKHMPDSSDEFKVDDSELSSDSGSDRARRKKAEEEDNADRKKALCDLIKKTAVVPLEKLPEDVTKAKTEELQAHLNAQAALEAQAMISRSSRGRGGRGGRGTRGPRGRRAAGAGAGAGTGAAAGAGSDAPPVDDALAKLVGVKIKDLRTDASPIKPNQAEREKKKQEREAKMAEKEAKRIERMQKKEEKEKMKEQKAKEREEKRLARLALQESKRLKKEKPEYPMSGPMPGYGMPIRPLGPEMQRIPEMQRMNMYGNPPMQRHPADFQDQRFPTTPRLQVRAELRGVLSAEDRTPHPHPHRPDQPPNALREGTLSVAGSPQPFKPVTEEPSIITRMPHMINQQYRGPMMYGPGNPAYGPRGPQNMGMYPHHLGMNPPTRQYPPHYYQQMRALHPPAYRGLPPSPGPSPGLHGPPGSSSHGPGLHGPPGSSSHGPGLHGPPSSSPHGSGLHGPPGSSPHGPGLHGPPGSSPHGPGLHGPPGSSPHGPGLHGPPGSSPHGPGLHGPPGSTPHGPGLHGSSAHGPGLHGHPGSSPHGLGLHGPPGSSPHGPGAHGHPGSSPHGPPGHQEQRHHGPLSHSPGLVPPGQMHAPTAPPSSPHGPVPHGPPGSTHGPPGSNHGPLGPRGSGPAPLGGLPLTRGLPPGPGPGPPGSPAPRGPTETPEPPIKIKAEVKTEPEYRSPPTSPRPPSPRDDPPRHPKIKHTENKDRRPRYPLGPYAPQYGPYGPYAPPPAPAAAPAPRMHPLHPYLPRSPPPRSEPEPAGPPYLPAHLRPPRPYMMGLGRAPAPQPDRMSPYTPPPYEGRPSPVPAAPEGAPVPGPATVKLERPPTPPRPTLQALASPREGTPDAPSPGPAPHPEARARLEDGVFGGLVSYFSSQREDDIDA